MENLKYLNIMMDDYAFEETFGRQLPFVDDSFDRRLAKAEEDDFLDWLEWHQDHADLYTSDF